MIQPEKISKFSPYVIEKIGWYVYALRDPRDKRVFYIGKGIGNRVFAHAQAAAKLPEDDDETAMSQKLGLITEILDAGLQVEAFLLRYQLKSSQEAYAVEAAVIDVLRLLSEKGDNDLFSLTNLVLGHHHTDRGLALAQVAASRFEAPPMPDVAEPLVIFGIPNLWTPSMGDAEVYEAGRGWWQLGERALGATYGLVAHRNVVRGVYRIDYWRERVEGDRDWEDDLGKKPRRGFKGEAAPEMAHLLHTSVKHIPAGGSVRYVNCPDGTPVVKPCYLGDDAREKAQLDGFGK